MFDGLDILVDLQTGTISLVIPAHEDVEKVELETVTADEPFAPQE